MDGHLKEIQNWAELARQSNWSATALAKNCNVSLRTLERYLLAKTGKHPHAWLCEERLRGAIQLLKDKATVKETAARLGYKNQHHFSREFKKLHGYPPSQRPEIHKETRERAAAG